MIGSPTYHYHACEKCGRIWAHDPIGDDCDMAKYAKMHRCCGRSWTLKFRRATPDQRKKADRNYRRRRARTLAARPGGLSGSPDDPKTRVEFCCDVLMTLLRAIFHPSVSEESTP